MVFFKKEKEQNYEQKIVDVLLERTAKKLNVSELAIDNAIGMIASTIAKSEIKIYRKNNKKIEENKTKNYYKLNVKPNINETATVFWFNVVYKLFKEGKALIVPINNDLYLAYSFDSDDYVISENTFYNIVIETNDNTYPINKTFKKSECIYLENPNKRVTELINTFNSEYAEYIKMAVGGYRGGNIDKYSMNVPQGVVMKEKNGNIVTSNEYADKIKDKLQSDNTEITVLQNGMSIDSISKSSVKNSDDITKLTETVFNYTAFAFNIPIDVYIGKTTEKSNAQNDFITFAIEPIIEIINDASNAFFFTEDEYLIGEKIEVDKTSIKHYDILDVATNLDKLFSIGFSHNDICKFVGLNTIDEPWANERHVTKNYGNEKGGANE